MRKYAYSKDIVITQLALILECCRGGGGACRGEHRNHPSIARRADMFIRSQLHLVNFFFWIATRQHSEPSARSSIAFRTPLSNALASAGLWKDRPHFLSSTFQWWNMGVAMVYTRSFLSGQSRITCMYKTKQRYWTYCIPIRTLIFCWYLRFYLFVPQPLTTNEELGKAGGWHGCQLWWQEAAYPDPAQSSPVLGQPASARVVPRHHHRFYTHDVAVTGKGERVYD